MGWIAAKKSLHTAKGMEKTSEVKLESESKIGSLSSSATTGNLKAGDLKSITSAMDLIDQHRKMTKGQKPLRSKNTTVSFGKKGRAIYAFIYNSNTIKLAFKWVAGGGDAPPPAVSSPNAAPPPEPSSRSASLASNEELAVMSRQLSHESFPDIDAKGDVPDGDPSGMDPFSALMSPDESVEVISIPQDVLGAVETTPAPRPETTTTQSPFDLLSSDIVIDTGDEEPDIVSDINRQMQRDVRRLVKKVNAVAKKRMTAMENGLHDQFKVYRYDNIVAVRLAGRNSDSINTLVSRFSFKETREIKIVKLAGKAYWLGESSTDDDGSITTLTGATRLTESAFQLKVMEETDLFSLENKNAAIAYLAYLDSQYGRFGKERHGAGKFSEFRRALSTGGMALKAKGLLPLSEVKRRIETALGPVNTRLGRFSVSTIAV